MMLESFGEEYRAYMTDTKRLIPWMLWLAETNLARKIHSFVLAAAYGD